MGDLGLVGAGGAQALGHSLEEVFLMRLRAAAQAEAQRQNLAQEAHGTRALNQQDELTRLKIQEMADAKAATQADRAQTQQRLSFQMIPQGADVGPSQAKAMIAQGIPQQLLPLKRVNAPAPPPSLAADPSQGDQPMPGTVANSPQPNALMHTRGLTDQEQEAATMHEQSTALMNAPDTSPMMKQFLRARMVLPKGENPPAGLFVDPQVKVDADRQRQDDKQENLRLAASLRPPPLVLVQTLDAQGNPVTLIRPKVAGSEFAGAATDTQRLSKAYLDRTVSSDHTAQAFEQHLSTLGAQINVQLPNLLRSQAGQQYRQAKDEFINAALRRESGAAIQPSEYARYDAIYFVQPGDTPATIKQKQEARSRVVTGFKTEAGSLGALDSKPDAKTKDPLGIR